MNTQKLVAAFGLTLFVGAALMLALRSCSDSSADLVKPTEVQLMRELIAASKQCDLGSPVIETVQCEAGTLVILAFANGDYQSWLFNAEGGVRSIGYRDNGGSLRISGTSFEQTTIR